MGSGGHLTMTTSLRFPKPEGCSEEHWRCRRQDVLRIWERRRIEDGVEPLLLDSICQTCWSSTPAETRYESCGKTAHVECLDTNDNCQECDIYTPSHHPCIEIFGVRTCRGGIQIQFFPGLANLTLTDSNRPYYEHLREMQVIHASSQSLCRYS